MDWTKIVDIAALVALPVILVVGVVIYMKRGLLKTLVSIVNCGISFMAATLLVGPIGSLITKHVGPAIVDILKGSLPIVESNSVINSLVCQIPAILIIPALFVALYFLLFGILDKIAFSIIGKKFSEEGKKPLDFKCSKLIAAVVSIPITFLGFWVVMMPITGSVDVMAPISSSINDISGESENSALALVDDIFSRVSESTLFNVARKAGTTNKYISLTSIKLGAKDIDIEKELEVVAEITEKLSEISTDAGLSSSTIKEIAFMLSNSEVATMAISETIRDAAVEWKEGNEYMGVKLLTGTDEEYDTMMTEVLTCMSTAEDEDVPDVLEVLAEIIDVIPTVSGEESNEDVANLLSKLDGERVYNLLMSAYENKTLAKSTDAMLKYVFEKASKAAGVDITEEIKKFSFANASKEDAETCASNVKLILDEASQFIDKIYNGDASLTDEEKASLNETFKKCESDPVIGDIASKFVEKYESNLQ